MMHADALLESSDHLNLEAENISENISEKKNDLQLRKLKWNQG